MWPGVEGGRADPLRSEYLSQRFGEMQADTEDQEREEASQETSSAKALMQGKSWCI